MSSADDRFAGDAETSTAASPYDEPTRAIDRPRVRRPQPDNDAFFDRHARGRRAAPAADAVSEPAVSEPAVSEPPVSEPPASEPAASESPAPEPAVAEPGGEDTAADARTAVIVNSVADAPAPAAQQGPVRKSSSDEPVHTEPFADVDDAPIDDDADGRRRYAEQLTEPPLPYIEPQPTVPLVVDEYEAEPLPEPVAADEPVATQAPKVRRGTLDLGLLILRLVVGATFTVHGLQKLTGWFNGPGPDGFADYLANHPNPSIGFRGDVTTILSLVAGVSETAGGILLILGLLTPIAGAAVLGTIAIATTYKVTLAGGLWFFAADGGGNGIELEVLLAAAAAALILTGPGTYSVDRRWGWSRRPAWGSAACVVVAIGAAVAIWILFNGTDPLTSPGNPAG